MCLCLYVFVYMPVLSAVVNSTLQTFVHECVFYVLMCVYMFVCVMCLFTTGTYAAAPSCFMIFMAQSTVPLYLCASRPLATDRHKDMKHQT